MSAVVSRYPWTRSPWARGAAAAVLMFAIGLLLITVIPEVRITWRAGAEPGYGPSVAVLAGACVGLVFRYRLPLVGLALGTAALAAGPCVLGASDLGTVLAFADVLYSAVLYSSRRVSEAVCLVCGALVAGLTITALVVAGGREALLALLNLLLLAVPVVWAAEVRRHRELAAAERARSAQAAQLAERDRQAAVSAERARMARDLHDIVAGQLSAIALQSEAALGDPTLAPRVVRGVRDASVSALAEMRTLIGLLRAEPGSEPRTAPARLDQLDRLLDQARSWGLRVEVRDDRPSSVPAPGPAATAAGVELAAYRIVQEGLTNVAKHAPGADVTLELRHRGDDLVLTLVNGPSTADGTAGATGLGTGGTGLVGLRERATAVGGTLAAGPVGDGWRIEAAVPRNGSADSDVADVYDEHDQVRLT